MRAVIQSATVSELRTSAEQQHAASAPPSTANTWKGLRKQAPTGAEPVNPSSLPTDFAVTNLDFDVTENCNLGCVYCFKGEMYPRNMSLDTMKRSFEWLLQASGSANSVNCNFMGGEPTMRFKQLKEFVPWARRRAQAIGKQATFSMTTNLTLFTEEIREFVDRYGFGVLMSIDGAPDVQDAQRPAKNGQLVSSTVEYWARSMLRTRPQAQARATVHPKYVHREAMRDTRAIRQSQRYGMRAIGHSRASPGVGLHAIQANMSTVCHCINIPALNPFAFPISWDFAPASRVQWGCYLAQAARLMVM
ncbi:MAG: radical SAM protein [Planctomycetes bacterium]|nr:radical SAM protein [Planctomycetota bacterium]